MAAAAEVAVASAEEAVTCRRDDVAIGIDDDGGVGVGVDGCATEIQLWQFGWTSAVSVLSSLWLRLVAVAEPYGR